jgi:hypothetical protein
MAFTLGAIPAPWSVDRASGALGSYLVIKSPVVSDSLKVAKATAKVKEHNENATLKSH